MHTYIYYFIKEPPGDVHVSDINPNQFTIEWSPPASINCPGVTYDIATSNCGVCPNTTSNTSVRCTNLTVDGRICSVFIQTKACETQLNTSEYSGATGLFISLRGNLLTPCY